MKKIGKTLIIVKNRMRIIRGGMRGNIMSKTQEVGGRGSMYQNVFKR